MKRDLRSTVLALFTAGFVVLAAGCETVQPHVFAMEPIENYGGGGGDGGND